MNDLKDIETIRPVFNKVRNHLLRQNAKSCGEYVESLSDEDKEKNKKGPNHCRFRGDNGRMCAVGVLISNGNYSSELEGAAIHRSNCGGDNVKASKLWTALQSSGIDCFPLMRLLLSSLQSIHDGTAPYDWKFKLQQTSIHFGLEITPQGYIDLNAHHQSIHNQPIRNYKSWNGDDYQALANGLVRRHPST